jgi:TRAP-type C4-dicarboxylate transport system substrate-binding protein
MKSVLERLLVALLFFSVVGSVVPVKSVAQTKERILKEHEEGPPVGVFAEAKIWMAEEITKRTNGSLKFKLFWAEALLKRPDALRGIGQGIADCGTAMGAFTEKLTPHLGATALPGAGDNIWAMQRASYDMWNTNPRVVADLDKINVVATYGYTPGTPMYVFKKPVTKASDMKGLRVRMPNATAAKMAAQLGIVPVTVNLFDIYDSMDKGVIDGCYATLQWLWDLKWYEVGKHVTLPKGSGFCMDISNFFNKDVWKSLTPGERDVIKKVADELNDRYARTVMEKEASWKKDMETKHGVIFHELDKEADAQNLAAMKVAREGYFEKYDPSGNKTKEVWEEFVAKVQKYEKEVAGKGYPWKR